MSRRAELLAIYRSLLAAFGPQRWWPARTPFEVCVGAILTQNTAWTHVERAIANLRRERVLGPRKLRRLAPRRLAGLLRPAGYFNVKERRLRAFLDLIHERHGGSIRRLLRQEPVRLREELLGVKGIGKETADSMVLYAAGAPRFVVDAYTHRVLCRHGLAAPGDGYDAVQALFEDALPREARLYNEYHALLVHLGKDYCRSRRPRCESCPLAWHPHEGTT
ncbi:MAG: endonuclease III domain-containing protein [Planctomycetes bacterium]|nr:endonuclease III domain-containing protein [Planctomycetota bacterium]